MLYFLYGTRSYIKDESKSIRAALLKKRPDAISLSFDEQSAEEADLEELSLGQGLFQSRYIVECTGLFGIGHFPDEKEAAERMAGSQNIFLVLEERLSSKTLGILKKYAEKTSEEKLLKGSARKEFSAFSLADALVSRNKKQLWVLFREAVLRGYALEELHGILFWQMKMIVLAHKTNSPEEAGVKAFPYSKARRARKNYSLKEAEATLHSLSRAIIEGRRGDSSLEHSTERAILSL